MVSTPAKKKMAAEQVRELVRELSEHKRTFDPQRIVPPPEKRLCPLMLQMRLSQAIAARLERLREICGVEDTVATPRQKEARAMGRIAVDPARW